MNDFGRWLDFDVTANTIMIGMGVFKDLTGVENE